MKVIEAIKGPLVIVLSSYDPKERSGTREYYGLGFIEVGRPQRFSKEKDVERADRFHEEVTAIIGEHPHYKAVEGYPFGVRFEKLYSPSEIADFRNSWAADHKRYHLPRRAGEGCILFHSALRFSREYPNVFRQFLESEAGIFSKSLIPKSDV